MIHYHHLLITLYPNFYPQQPPQRDAAKDLAAVAACLAAAASGADLLPRSRRDLVAWHLDLWMTG